MHTHILWKNFFLPQLLSMKKNRCKQKYIFCIKCKKDEQWIYVCIMNAMLLLLHVKLCLFFFFSLSFMWFQQRRRHCSTYTCSLKCRLGPHIYFTAFIITVIIYFIFLFFSFLFLEFFSWDETTCNTSVSSHKNGCW